MSRFLQRSLLPAFVVGLLTSILSIVLPDTISHATVTLSFFKPVMYQCVLIFFLFACLPSDMHEFMCFKLAYATKATVIPWEMVVRAWCFAWDAYYDDPRALEPSDSGEGALIWTRKCLRQDDPIRFVSCKESDTHAQLAVSTSGQLVVCFRGTGSMANISTDCSVSRREMRCKDGLQFETDDSDIVHAERPVEEPSRRRGAAVVKTAQDATAWFTDVMGSVAGIRDRCMVHGGFVRAYLSVREQLLEQHASLCAQHEPTSVLVTGHSLGGALATIFALDLLMRRLHTPEQVWMVTFGQPRVGNHAFAKVFKLLTNNSQCFRIVFKGDVVAGIPKLLWLFKHVEVEVEIDDEGHVLCDPSPLERSFVSASHRSAASHSMTSYEAGLRACLTGMDMETDKVFEHNEQVYPDGAGPENPANAQASHVLLPALQRAPDEVSEADSVVLV
eukprot:TRINITY_DN8235_c0_g1_i3.p1 TRINITY_DN8235_c0_g1~~TRINITY_DN8235_c0_g1_i3.p1  ORF type:complete len:446 (-),score=94.99 TRINITY_DN8235_c0_g1_i3:378-1715(-)